MAIYDKYVDIFRRTEVRNKSVTNYTTEKIASGIPASIQSQKFGGLLALMSTGNVNSGMFKIYVDGPSLSLSGIDLKTKDILVDTQINSAYQITESPYNMRGHHYSLDAKEIEWHG